MSQDMAVADASELNLLLAQRRQHPMQQRSESAPPTVQGSLAALGLADASEAELRSDPAYLAYYQSHVNLNPRLPPPVKSWENWRLAQRLQFARSTFGLEDNGSSGSSSSRSLFSSQPPLPTHREEAEAEVAESLEHLLLRRQQQPTTIVQQRQRQQEGDSNAAPKPTNKSLVDLIQEDFPRTPSPVYNQSRPSSRAAAVHASSEDGVVDGLLVRARSTTPKPATAPASERNATASLGLADLSTSTADLAAALKRLDVRHEDAGLDGRRGGQQEHQQQQQQQQLQQQQRQEQRYHHPAHQPHHYQVPFAQQQQQQAKLPLSAHNMYAAAAAAAAMSYMAPGSPCYHGSYPTPYGYAPSMLPPPLSMMPGYPASPMAAEQFHKLTGHIPNTLQDAFYLQYLRASEDAARALAEIRNSYSAASDELYGHEQKQQQQQQHFPARSGAVGGMPVPCVKTSASAAPAFYGSPPGFALPFPSSPLAGSPVLPSSPVASLRRDERGLRMGTAAPIVSRLPVPMSTYAASYNGEEMRGSFLLEEFKSNKARRFDLSDISGHIVEFSADQHGSRFIQQKLESATADEKSMVFQEVLPHAVSLMTDVFGNYVIQKFFEHGNQIQRKELARQLVGRVLTLSLQMYGCRVIQKALEVIDVDQQAQLVSELDGHVMRCVRDQNGNHVIQKCIECVPSDRIQFIISAFYGQVVALSTHPYGCRVIQRVLEHCSQEQKQEGIIDEIVRSTCSLAQDQYGNYVVQHVLEHGTQEDRTEIITRLAGQIVQMSQHKFASNVIEKCLQFGSPAQRQIIINEMLGQTQENEALQAMMKDQFANYVVQKVLETCDDEQREFLLSRIKVHLHALKKYTYGKHIVARVEKLVAAGERRSAAVAAAAGSQSTS